MRVLHVIPSVDERSGGPATAIVPLCRALIQQGIDVLLLSTTAGLSHGTPPSGINEYKGVPAIFFQAQLEASFKYSRPLSSWLRSNIQRFDAVHIHAVFNHSSVAAAHVCQKTGVSYVVRPLGTLDPWSMTQKSLRKRLFWQISGKGLMQNAAGVHYTSEAEKAATEGSLGLNHGRVIPLGVEAASIVSTNRLGQIFPDLARDPYVLVLSRLHPKKNLDVLIEAFFSLVQSPKFAEWRLVLAGDGPVDYVSMLKAKVAANSHKDKVTFTGWLEGDNKNAVLRGASLLVLPSQQENFGLCVMEALSQSVPVLVSPNVNLAQEIAAANAGWIAPVDRTALADKLAEALADREELTNRGLAGRQLSQKYSWENSARELVELYRAVIQDRRNNGSAHVH
ncbi:MAG TPA: glycosyltransferase [Pyrinomonadaceae bacterium]|jgi:glycosyltransferase involved in cell wall biosynthesis|nr:glycosyltransferase [Pyrinomonadaceae bacterium]